MSTLYTNVRRDGVMFNILITDMPQINANNLQKIKIIGTSSQAHAEVIT